MDIINAQMASSSTPIKRQYKFINSPTSPNISRYGRTHKPKMQDDYVSTDKKVSAYLKLSPGNQIQYFSPIETKKKASPRKSDDGAPRRGRPPKSPVKNLNGELVPAPKVEIKVEPQDPNTPVDGCEWMVGDLAWARVGGHPFWPCIIALDPVQKIFTKTIRKGRTAVSQRWVHVQFFGDNGRRSWLNSTSVINYSGRDAFIQLGDTILAGMRKKEPKQTSAFVIKPAVIQVWEKAVQEAEDLFNASREERVAFFARHFPPELQPAPPTLTRDELIEKVFDTSQSPPKKRGRKRKAEQSPLEEEVKKKQIKLEDEVKEEAKPMDPLLSSTPRTIADRKKRQALLMQIARSNQPPAGSSSPPTPCGVLRDSPPTLVDPVVRIHPMKRPLPVVESAPVIEEKKPKKKYVKKKVAVDFQAFSSKHFDRVSDDHPELNEKEINKYLQKMWNEMDDSQKAKYRSRLGAQEKEDSESSEEVSEDVEVEDVEEEIRSSKSSSPAPLAAATQKPSAAKRVNYFRCLFSGAKSEKVCQICERTGDTVRCRGPCQGYYHPDCITNPPVAQTLEATPAKRGRKKGRPKKSMTESPHPVNSQPLDDQKENNRLSLKEVSLDTKETEIKLEPNGVADKKDEADLVEIIEPEVKPIAKARKGSKDSESGSSEEGEGFRCKDCQEGRSQPCFVCHEYIHKKSGEAKLYRCITSYCGKVYHEGCLKLWPQTSWRSNGNGKGCDRGVLTCPQHTCHTCASDNPGVIKARYSNDKLVRCVRCPTTYHYGNYCLPAGSEILTNTQIICPQHYKPPKKTLIQHINAAWCFICASGGSLICCDLCPTSFHADCLNISTPPDGSYVCEDCQTGRFPLYGEIVWVKLGVYRWWPAQILYPALIPDNIVNLPHVQGEFAVKFFGSHDHYWVNRGRVFLYQDGDTAGKSNSKKSSVDTVFERAVREASEAQRKYLEEKATRDAETRPGMKPPNYVKLKTNRPVGNVRTMELNVSSLTPCECDSKSKAPCAPDSDCLNRILMVECHPLVCPAGEKCCNQLFEKRQYPPLQPYHTQGRGWGLKTLVPLKKGDFVIEYVGEMIDEEEYKKRLVQMHENNEENFYFLTIDKDRLLDAGPKGNVARFMNHSCQPNCETQKWTVNGDTRVGLFALSDVPAGTELVFNYNLESIGSDKKPCMCGAPNCSGFIGVKAIKNQEREETKEKKTVKKKKAAVVSKAHEEDCFICGEGGELLLCDGKLCLKGYHLSCLGKKQRTQGYWLCPWHQCNVCNKGRVRRCTFCVNSYCQEHSEGNIRLDPVKGLLCSKHDPEKASDNSKELDAENKSTPMEIDLSENASVVSRPEAVDSSSLVESINNNVIKSVTPARRSQRSKSDTPRTEKIINGIIQKVTIRKSRPSSIDDNLIVSQKKTDQDCAQTFSQNNDTAESHNHVTELLNDVLSNLPIEENLSLETVKEEANSVNGKLDKTTEEKESEGANSVNGKIDKTAEEGEISEVDKKVQPSKEEMKSKVKYTISLSKGEELGEAESNIKARESTSKTLTSVSKSEELGGAESNVNARESTSKSITSVSKSEELGEKESNVNASEPTSKTLTSVSKSEELGEKESNVNTSESTSKTLTSVSKSEELGEKESNVNASESTSKTLTSVSKSEELGEKESNVNANEPTSVSKSEELGEKESNLNASESTSVSKSEELGEDESNVNAREPTSKTLTGTVIDQNEDARRTEGQTIESVDSENGKPSEETEADQDVGFNPHEIEMDFNHESCLNTENDLAKASNILTKDSIHLNGSVKSSHFIDSSNLNKIEKDSKANVLSQDTTNLDHSNQTFTEKECSKTSKDDTNDKQNEVLLDNDDHADDFELSYSEYSNDKLYKSINNSESSLEMKLTDCISSENSENEGIPNKIEQISTKNELVNCIEQASAMEVA